MIRKITRGKINFGSESSSSNIPETTTISCTITDTSKVIVLLDSAGYFPFISSINSNGIVIDNHKYSYSSGGTVTKTYYTAADFYYQIIEFL